MDQGHWNGNWGSGALHVAINGAGQGTISLPGHAEGTVTISAQNGLITAHIVRKDGLIQGFVGARIIRVVWWASTFMPTLLTGSP